MDQDYESDHGARRRENGRERLGTRDPRCALCAETDPLSLVRRGDVILCYECRAEQHGKAPLEKHHVMGRHNDPLTVPIPVNDHRIMSDLQIDWPRSTLRNPHVSPLLRAAAALRGWLDVLWLLIDRAVGGIPSFLEWLDAHLCNEIGEHWWLDWGWDDRPS